VAEETTIPVELLQKVETERNLSETEKYPDTSTDFSQFMKIELDNEISEKSKIKSIVWTESDITAALILSKSGRIYIFIYVHIHICTCIHAHIYIYIHVYVRKYIFIYFMD
jgi:hypothetical protein